MEGGGGFMSELRRAVSLLQVNSSVKPPKSRFLQHPISVPKGRPEALETGAERRKRGMRRDHGPKERGSEGRGEREKREDSVRSLCEHCVANLTE